MKDVIIIGGGPAGVTAAIYGQRAGLDLLLFERQTIGGAVNNAGLIENYPGYIAINGLALGRLFKDQIDTLKIPLIMQEVIKITKGKTFQVFTQSDIYEAKAVIIATGSIPRKLGLSNEKKLVGNGVSYCAYCDGSFYKDEPVVIIGGGNSATEAALYLAKITKMVYLLTNDTQLRADQITVDQVLNEKKIKVITNAKLLSLDEKQGQLVGITYQKNNKTELLSVTGAFIYVGHISNTQFLSTNYNTLLNDKGAIITSDTKTKINGLFVAGDCSSKPVKQIVTATSDGAQALINVLAYLKTQA